jgi:hypothetical protein
MIKRMNKTSLLTILIVALIFLLGFVFRTEVYGMVEKATKILSKEERKQLNKSVFEKDGILYLYHEKSGKITSLLDDGVPKYNPVISPDRKKLAFVYGELEPNYNEMTLGVLDLKNKSVQPLVIKSKNSNMVMYVEWIGNDKVGVEGHVNPSTSEYFVFDVISGQYIKQYLGSLFTVMPNEMILYRAHIPHGGETKVKDELVLEDTIIYTSDEKETSLGYPQLSPKHKKIAFIERNDEAVNGKKLIVADFDYNLKKISNTKKINIPEDIHGDLLYDTTDQLYVVGKEKKYKLNETKGHFEETQLEENQEYKEEFKTKMKGFNAAIEARFGSDVEPGEFKHVQWFE